MYLHMVAAICIHITRVARCDWVLPAETHMYMYRTSCNSKAPKGLVIRTSTFNSLQKRFGWLCGMITVEINDFPAPSEFELIILLRTLRRTHTIHIAHAETCFSWLYVHIVCSVIYCLVQLMSDTGSVCNLVLHTCHWRKHFS